MGGANTLRRQFVHSTTQPAKASSASIDFAQWLHVKVNIVYHNVRPPSMTTSEPVM